MKAIRLHLGKSGCPGDTLRINPFLTTERLKMPFVLEPLEGEDHDLFEDEEDEEEDNEDDLEAPVSVFFLRMKACVEVKKGMC